MCLKGDLKRRLAERTGTLMARAKPLVQTAGMELMATRFASSLRERMVRGVYDRIANRALLDTFKLLFNIASPEFDGIEDSSILVSEEGRN